MTPHLAAYLSVILIALVPVIGIIVLTLEKRKHAWSLWTYLQVAVLVATSGSTALMAYSNAI